MSLLRDKKRANRIAVYSSLIEGPVIDVNLSIIENIYSDEEVDFFLNILGKMIEETVEVMDNMVEVRRGGDICGPY